MRQELNKLSSSTVDLSWDIEETKAGAEAVTGLPRGKGRWIRQTPGGRRGLLSPEPLMPVVRPLFGNRVARMLEG